MLHHRIRAASNNQPDPYFNYTVLLLSGEGSNGGQNNTFVDDSTNNFSITRFGNTTQGSFSPFPPAAGVPYNAATHGGSGYFDGSGDYLSVADNAALEVGSGDFTLEVWVYYLGPNPAYGANIISKGNSSSFGPYAIGLNPSTGKVEALASFSGSTWNLTLTSSATLPTGTWTHLAYVRSGSTFTLYVNGTSNATTTSSSSLVDNTENLLVGKTNYVNTEFPGYITGVRLVKGTAVYSGSSFTVPTAPLTNITNTSLLLNFTNAGILDSTAKNDLETVGDAQISTSVKKFGTGSLKFDGSGDGLVIPKNSLLDFGTGDWTIECWIYTTSLSAQNTIVDMRPANTSGAQVYFSVKTNGSLLLYVSTAERITSSSGAISTNTWYHVAICRSGTSTKMFIDGTQVGSTWTDSTNYTAETRIGVSAYSAVSEYFTGYIDDLRITKGIARYTANFTPPLKSLPTK